MNDLTEADCDFSENRFWCKPIPHENIDWDLIESNRAVSLFDHTGYDLCPLEQEYARFNECEFPTTIHRNDRHISLQTPWFQQEEKLEGYVLNHSMLLRRYAYSGEALDQLKVFVDRNPLINKVIHIESKWGFDFSLDYVSRDETFEIFHYEYDSFDYNNIVFMRNKLSRMIHTTDFDMVAMDLKARKKDWINLEFFEQSNWKCAYFGVPNERFKMVIWQT